MPEIEKALHDTDADVRKSAKVALNKIALDGEIEEN
jgi:hypothetical protein